MDARLEIKKFEENGQTQFSLRLQGYIDDMLDMTAMLMISIADKYNVSLNKGQSRDPETKAGSNPREICFSAGVGSQDDGGKT